MLYALLGSGGLAVFFLILYVREISVSSRLKTQNEALRKDNEIKTKQLNIAATFPGTPAELIKLMQDNQL